MGDGPASVHLVARVGGKLLALTLPHVVEVMRPLAVAGLEGAPACVRGAAVVRGGPVPVIDGRALLGEPPGALPAARWIALRLGARRAVLAVDEVIGTRAVGGEKLAAMPPLLRGVASGLGEAIGSLDEELLLVLRAGRLVPESAWGALEGQPEP